MAKAALLPILKTRAGQFDRLAALKGGAGSGNFNHAGCPGQVGGSCKPGGGGSLGKPVPFNRNPKKQYPTAPDDPRGHLKGPERQDQLLNTRKRLQELGMLENGNLVLYHVTAEENVGSISKAGLVPKGAAAAGQDFKALHSDYAIYFHSDKKVAMRDIEQSVGLKIVKAHIPVTDETLSRILPDEDVYLNNAKGVDALLEKASVAFIGGVPKSAIKVMK
jgi:hypothetical protein